MSKFIDVLNKLKASRQEPPRTVEVISKNPISSTVINQILEVFGKKISVLQHIDSNMSMGMKIVVDDTMVDLSVDDYVGDIASRFKTLKIENVSSFADEAKNIVNQYRHEHNVVEIGRVVSVKDATVQVSGLTKCVNGELLLINETVRAVAINLEERTVGAILFDDKNVKPGDLVFRTNSTITVSAGDQLLGHVLDGLGKPIDGYILPQGLKEMPIEKVAPGVMDRTPVTVPLATGIKVIDALIPIGRGQRELILGDRQTGKTAIAVDAIINQKDSGVICIYVAIGQKMSKVAALEKKLRSLGAMDNTIIVNATASENAAMLYMAPYSATAIAEYFAEKGKDVLIIYDDLSKHAVAYREISLLLRRPPGREAYPGDVFYLHSRLLERSCRLNDENGGGSITSLPIVETQAGDISAYIPTNVISITDGQIFLETDLFYRGVKPAVNVGLSVSRVGGAAQIKPMKKVAGALKLSLAQYRELEAFAQISSDLDKKTKEQIERGKRLVEVIKQDQYQPMETAKQVVVLYVISNGHFDKVAVEDIRKAQFELLEKVELENPQLLKDLSAGNWGPEQEEQIKSLVDHFIDSSEYGKSQE